MTALVAIETVVLVLLAVLVVGLLRSHADILKALHDLGVGVEPDGTAHDHAGHLAGSSNGFVPVAGPDVARSRHASDLVGVTPSGDALAVSLSGADDTLLAFLSSGCATCEPLWRALQAPGFRTPGGARVVVVTRGDDLESPTRVAELAQGVRVPVLRSSEGWESFQVPGAPYFVSVEAGTGRIRGEGTASTWERVFELVERAQADEGATRPPEELADHLAARRRLEALSNDRAREARADQELAAAGILPGDPRLYVAERSLDTDSLAAAENAEEARGT